VNLEKPFLPGQTSQGQITVPGYEHIRMEVAVQEMTPEKFFSYTWHPYAIEPGVDYSMEPPTLVEFRLAKIESGTRLTVTESGFSRIPAERRSEAFRMNDHGWSQQMKDIQSHVEQTE
jgi:uncharacterized protein YndB with AHSA1/START domain